MAQSDKSKQTQSASDAKESKLSFGSIFAIAALAILCFAGYNTYSDWAHTESVNSAQQLSSEVLRVSGQFKDGDDYVSESNVDAYQNAVYKYVKEYESFWVEATGKTETGVWVEFKNGMTILFDPPVKGYLGADTRASCLITEYKPHLFPASDDSYFEIIDSNGGSIAGHFDSWHPEVYSFGSVNLEAVDSMGVKNTQQIILWTGHGGYASEFGSYLLMGELADWDLLKSDRNQYKGYDIDSLLFNGETREIAITSKFVEKYVEDLDGALIYLGACFGGHDRRLSDAFISAGADTVVGYTQKTHLSYHAKLSQAFFEAMCSKDSDGNYLNVQKAMRQAQTEVGNSDSPIDGIKSMPRIYGDERYAFKGDSASYSPNPPSDASSPGDEDDSGDEPAENPDEAQNLTKRVHDGMWFLPAQNGSYGYGPIARAYISGYQLVFIGGGATRGWPQGDGVMMEDQPGENSSFKLTDSTAFSYRGSAISKSQCADYLAKGESFDWIQVDVSNDVVTAVHL